VIGTGISLLVLRGGQRILRDARLAAADH
jgi:hypothetical protein